MRQQNYAGVDGRLSEPCQAREDRELGLRTPIGASGNSSIILPCKHRYRIVAIHNKIINQNKPLLSKSSFSNSHLVLQKMNYVAGFISSIRPPTRTSSEKAGNEYNQVVGPKFEDELNFFH